MTVDALLRTTTVSAQSESATPLPMLRTRQLTVTVEPGVHRCAGLAATFSTTRSGYGANADVKLAVAALLASFDSATLFSVSEMIVTCRLPVAVGPSGRTSVV